jgi:hypothetical protein
LLDLFKNHTRCCHSCCGSECGCGGAGYEDGQAPTAAPQGDAPVPPAPMADPSASARPRRHVMNASRVVRH